MILTPLNKRALEDAAYLEQAEAQIPIRRAGLPADIAGMAVYLASDASSFHTGDSFLIDGGYAIF
jgi:NAD(P)-dependent dehydrogenase (short-subunit alcohol dehydrogenase family)